MNLSCFQPCCFVIFHVRVPEHALLYTVSHNGKHNNRWCFLQCRGSRLAGFMQTKNQDEKAPSSSDRKLAFWPQQKMAAFSFNKLIHIALVLISVFFIYFSFVNSLTKTVFPDLQQLIDLHLYTYPTQLSPRHIKIPVS